MTKRTYLLYGLLVAGLLAAAALFLSLSWSVKATVAQAVRGPAVEAVYATGEVEPVRWAKVAPTEIGRLVDIGARDGETVIRGEVLARLDDREARAKLAELEAQEQFRREELDRYSKLAQRSTASRQAFERAASEFAAARAAVRAALQRVDDLTLTAPMDGTVLRQDGEVGDVIAAGETLFWIGQRRPLRVTAEVDEEDIPLVTAGQRTLIKSDAYQRRVLEGTVAEITPKGDPVNKNYRVRIALPDDTPLLIGMTTELNIIVRESADALLVPFEALRSAHVWVVEDGRAIRRKVTVGIVGDRMVQITGGLDEGATVIVDPPADLEDGDRVRPQEGN